jgi:single-strand DNA-binding protein
VANFTVASTPRMFDRQSNEWKDGETLFMRCSIWRDAAENVAESLQRGARVIVSGRLKQRSYEKDGQQRTVVEMEADEVGPSLKYATAKVNKTQRGGGGGFGGGQQGGGQQGGFGGQQQEDPWATGPSSAPQQGGGQQAAPQGGGQQGGWGSNAPSYDEPPF